MKRGLVGLLLLAACSTAPRPALTDSTDAGRPGARRDVVRVGLAVAVEAAELSARKSIDVLDRRGQRLTTLPPGPPLRLRAEAGRVVLERAGSIVWDAPSKPWIRLTTDGLWRAKDNEYAGDMIVRVAEPPRRVTLINRVGIEDYLRGVVPWEIGRPDDDALEAVKAQAIAARTYTYSHLDHWQDLGFDLHDSVTDQVYRGRTGTHPITDRAVRETRDRVLTHDGALVRAYYSSTCGGHGSTLADVWTREPAAYLSGRRDAAGRTIASWCTDSPHFRWSVAWSARELGEIVRRHLPQEIDVREESIGALRGLEVLERDASGRVKRLRIETDRGDHEVFGDRIRWVIRPPRGRFGILRSTLFSLEAIERDGVLQAVRVTGGGFGHGVGMCQTGALGMARAGRSARQILEHYYPGVRVERVPSRLVSR